MRSHRLIPLLLLVASATLLLPPAASAQGKLKKIFAGKAYDNDEIVRLTGTVTDTEGRPIAELPVTLEGSRRHFKITKLKKVSDHPRRISTKTNQRGEFTLDWTWHDYYNHFHLFAEVPVLRAGGVDQPEVLAEIDISTRILNGSPVVANLAIEDTSFLENMRSFLASLNTQDEISTYGSRGKPDKVETLRFPDREEVSWWYFSQGKTYRFLDGEIEQVVDFDPVQSFN